MHEPTPRHLLAGLTLIFVVGVPQYLAAQGRQDVQARYIDILRLRGREAYQEAISSLQKLISEYPDFHRAYRSLTETYIATDNLEGAEKFLEARIEDQPQNPYPYISLARIRFLSGGLDDALKILDKALGMDPNLSAAYVRPCGLPDIYHQQGQLDVARDRFQELALSRPDSAAVQYGLGRVHTLRYEWEQGLQALHKAMELDPDTTEAYHEAIHSYFMMGRYSESLDYSAKLLPIARRIGDLDREIYALQMLGSSNLVQGDYWEALQYLNLALKQAREFGFESRESTLLNNLGALYAMSGNYNQAREHFQANLEIAKKTGDIQTEFRMLYNTGTTYKDQHLYNDALRHYEEALRRARETRQKYEQGLVLPEMADVFQSLGKYDRARQLFEEALDIAVETQDRAGEGHVLGYLGSLSAELGDNPEAVRYYEQALEIGEETEEIQITWEARGGLGSTFEKMGETEQSIFHYAEAIALYDVVRESLVIESLGEAFLEDKYQTYSSIIRLLAQQGRTEEAFTYAEKYKAKNLLQSLSQAPAFLAGLVPEELRSQVGDIAAELEAAHRELSLEEAKADRSPDKIRSLNETVTDLEIRKASLMETIEEEHSGFYQLTSAEPLAAQEVQASILAPQQVLLEYVVGSENLSIFVVTAGELAYRDVAVGREELAKLLADLSPIFKTDKSSDPSAQGQIFNALLADFSVPQAQTLYDVLIKPIEPWLGEAAELIIVPDDILFYLPFETLVVRAEDSENRYAFGGAEFLVEVYSISYAASASVLDPSLQPPRQADAVLLACGNPDFAGGDRDLPADFLTATLAYRDGILRGNRLVPLPNSKKEVEAIGDVFSGLDTQIYTGPGATESTFKKEAGRYQILHLATHFLTDDRRPLYSKIALAQGSDSSEDGFLQTYEVFNLQLNADLVVLSACNTGLGKLSKGEGLVGVSRAFLYAGVPSLVVSMWSVDDEATSIIMSSFYRHLREGVDKKQALRQAKLEYLDEARGNKIDPFYWAPFVLLGDWAPLDFSAPSFSTTRLWLMAVASMVLLLVVVLSRRWFRSNITDR